LIFVVLANKRAVGVEEEQELTTVKRSRRVVFAYYTAPRRWSGIVSVIITESDNRNFFVINWYSFFSGANAMSTYTNKLNDNDQQCFLLVLDKNLHNDRSDECPYLIFMFSHDYRVHKMTEEDVLQVADVIHM
jgi:hypothetical protein